jgi:hypothetical protein
LAKKESAERQEIANREREKERVKAHLERQKKEQEEAKRAEEERNRKMEILRAIQEEERRNIEARAEEERQRQIRIEQADAIKRQRLEEAKRRRLQVLAAKRRLVWAMVRSKTQHIVQFPSAPRFESVNPPAVPMIELHPAVKELERLHLESLSSSLGRGWNHVVSFGETLRQNVPYWKSERMPIGDRDERTFLLKFAVILPSGTGVYVKDLVKSWLMTRLRFDECIQQDDIRFCFVFQDSIDMDAPADGAILVVPPLNKRQETVEAITRMIQTISSDIPKHALVLPTKDGIENNGSLDFLNQLVSSWVSCDVCSAIAFDHSLEQCLSNLALSMIKYCPFEVERMASSRFLYECARRAIWLENALTIREDICDVIENEVRRAIESVVYSCFEMRHWPDKLLINSCPTLPANWAALSQRLIIEPQLMAFIVILRSSSLPKAIELLVEDAPSRIQAECWRFNDQRRFRSALDLALAWRAGREDPESAENYVYAPIGELERILRRIDVCDDDTEGSTRTLLFDQTAVHAHSALDTARPLVVLEPTNPSDVHCRETTRSRRPPSQQGRSGGKRKADIYERPRKVCRTVQQSQNFTDRLQALAGGDTINMLLGTGSSNLTTLRSALSGAKPLSR